MTQAQSTQNQGDEDWPGDVVSCDWLAARLGAPDLIVLDASFYLPGDPRSADSLFSAAHLPGARRFDLDACSVSDSPLPHMALPPEAFAAFASAAGIDSRSRIVFYDQLGLFSAPRGWWLMQLYGHARAAVLDGGLPKWIAEGRALESGAARLVAAARAGAPARFNAGLRPELIRDLAAMRANLVTGNERVLDARPAARFTGEAPEPRPGLRAGHIPGAVSLPWCSLLNPDQTLPGRETLYRRFEQLGVDPQTRVVTSCGSGVSAALLTLALRQAGLPMGALYDGSWAEWGAHPELPVEQGPGRSAADHNVTN